MKGIVKGIVKAIPEILAMLPKAICDAEGMNALTKMSAEFQLHVDRADAAIHEFERRMNALKLYTPVMGKDAFFAQYRLGWARWSQVNGRTKKETFMGFKLVTAAPDPMGMMMGGGARTEQLVEQLAEIRVAAIPHFREIITLIERDMKRTIAIGNGGVVPPDPYASGHVVHDHRDNDDDPEEHRGHGCPDDPDKLQ